MKLATFFKKQSRSLIERGKLSEDHRKVEEAVDHFIQQMEFHADNRALIQQQREQLSKLVKDNAVCPKCNTSDKLRFVGTEKNEKGWKSNRYKCRKCNIQFTWNRPNNPWDMIKFIEEIIDDIEKKLQDETLSDEEREQTRSGLESMQGNLARLKPVIEAHDAEYNAIVTRDSEMERLIHEFKNSLLIEKIKMDTWENKIK